MEVLYCITTNHYVKPDSSLAAYGRVLLQKLESRNGLYRKATDLGLEVDNTMCDTSIVSPFYCCIVSDR